MNSFKRTATMRLTALVIVLCMVFTPLSAQASQPTAKRDIADATVYAHENYFQGIPVGPVLNVYLDGKALAEGEDFVVLAENNVNIGTASYCIVGIGDYYGYIKGEFTIGNEMNKLYQLKGAYNGNATGELNDQIYYQEILHTPGVFKARLDTTVGHYVRNAYGYYGLYRVEGEEPILVAEKETEYGYGAKTEFTYDFSDVYEQYAQEGGAVFVLAYQWVDDEYDVFSGACVLMVPAKVPDTTALVAEKVENEGDFRREYVAVYGTDGNVGDVAWSTSDASVATVEDGVVTLKTPGSVTITGAYGSLTANQVLEVAARPLSQCTFSSYDLQTGKAELLCDRIPMIEGTDYTCAVSVSEDVTEVTFTGKGLFTGQLMGQFDSQTGALIGQIHSFDSSSDKICNDCDYNRHSEHRFSQEWSKDQSHHWHTCTVCGERSAMEEHTPNAEDPTVCSVCGKLYIPGDIDGDLQVDREDVTQLLLHVSMPDAFPIQVPADFTADGTVNRDDVIQLLLHISMPDAFPL